ncbi:hypothetical protein GCM10027521_57000 [Amycolatopsis cihanbeyliensis]
MWSWLRDRDRRILALLEAHKVLTTAQIAALEFPTLDRAQRRLVALARRGLLWRWRPAVVGGGSAPHHYALGYLGAQLLAAQRVEDPPRPGAWQTRLTRLAESPQLRHLLGTNQFFCDLVQYACAHPEECVGPEKGFGGLTLWMSEITAREWFGEFEGAGWVRPDSYGCFEERGRMVRFFLEYDTGTESLQRLLEKVKRYEEMATDAFGIVLFWLHSARRERTVHRALAKAIGGERLRFVMATAARDHGDPDGPAGAVWAVVGKARLDVDAASAQWLVRLADLPQRGPREHWPPLLDKPFTMAMIEQPTFHQRRFGMTAEEMKARGLDPATGQRAIKRNPYTGQPIKDDEVDIELYDDTGDDEDPVTLDGVQRRMAAQPPVRGRTDEPWSLPRNRKRQ